MLSSCASIECNRSGKLITTIEVLSSSDVMVVGRTMQLVIEARTADGEVVDAPDASWSVSDATVAEVTGAGLVTGVGVGEAVVTATADGLEDTFAVRVAPDALPLFTAAPFEGAFELQNPFDHDIPIWSGRAGQILTWEGFNVPGLEGHYGYDWNMPRGTPLFAVADGVVNFAGSESPWSCPLLNGATVAAQVVGIVHTAESGERFVSMYVHLDRVDVEAGDAVEAGQRIGVSGNTGCSTGPHLHFAVGREFYQRTPVENRVVVMDPNGWDGLQPDPWLLDDGGAPSSLLWADGAAPAFSHASMLESDDAAATPDSPLHMHRFTPPPLPPR